MHGVVQIDPVLFQTDPAADQVHSQPSVTHGGTVVELVVPVVVLLTVVVLLVPVVVLVSVVLDVVDGVVLDVVVLVEVVEVVDVVEVVEVVDDVELVLLVVVVPQLTGEIVTVDGTPVQAVPVISVSVFEPPSQKSGSVTW